MNPQLFPQTSSSDQQSASPHPSSGMPQPSNDEMTPPASGRFAGIERSLYTLFAKKLPQMPTSGRDMIADYIPWLTLIMCMVMFPIILTAVINGGIIGIITSINEINKNPAYWITLVLFLLQFILMCVATWHLLAHRRAGWKALFVASLIGIVYTVTQIFSGFADPLVTTPVLLLLDCAALYILYQARGYYSD